MSGNSYTALNPGSGGDNVYDEDIGGSPVVKMPASKIHTGALGVDGGPVTAGNPYPVQSYDGASSPVFPNVAAAADAEANATAITRLLARIAAYNGSTWDRIQAGVTTIGSTFTGFVNLLPWAIYHSSRTTRTNGQGGPLETNSQGDLTFQGAPLNVYSFTAIPVNGVQVGSYTGAGVGFVVYSINTTGSTEFLHVFDATASQSNGTIPLQTSASTATANFSQTTLGSAFYGLKFTNGLWLQPSTSLATMTKLASSTNNAGYVLWLPS